MSVYNFGLHLFSQKRQYRSSAKIGLTEILILFKIKYFKSQWWKVKYEHLEWSSRTGCLLKLLWLRLNERICKVSQTIFTAGVNNTKIVKITDSILPLKISNLLSDLMGAFILSPIDSYQCNLKHVKMLLSTWCKRRQSILILIV